MSNLNITDMPDWVFRTLEAVGSEIIDAEKGYVTCPGADLHTAPTAPNHCTLFHNADKSWVLYCHHTSCKDTVDHANAAFRGARPDKLSKVDAGFARAARANAQAAARRRALWANALPRILAEYPWPYAQIVADSPKAITGPVTDHWRYIIGLFAPDDIIWCGDVKTSGQPRHHACFQPAADWLLDDECPANFTCASTFLPGSYSRCGPAIKSQPYLVVESDHLSKDQIGSIFRWLNESVGLRLRAVVDTGGKSLHGWFRFPDQYRLDELKEALPHLRCDPKMFGASQPCRLPGALREETGRHQRLIYLD